LSGGFLFIVHCLRWLQELILFSRADLDRSIPSMLDGLKPGQRKILFACFKRNLKKDIKV
jgi:DNA topoisomerase-2